MEGTLHTGLHTRFASTRLSIAPQDYVVWTFELESRATGPSHVTRLQNLKDKEGRARLAPDKQDIEVSEREREPEYSYGSPVEFCSCSQRDEIWDEETAKKGTKNTSCRRFASHEVVNRK